MFHCARMEDEKSSGYFAVPYIFRMISTDSHSMASVA